MIEGWAIIVLALAYVSGLFALAWYADRTVRSRKGTGGRPLIYALSLAVYCTSWTFFGSVGFAASNGYAFFAPSMNSATHRQLSLLGDLRHAIERDQLLLHYQPKFQAADGGVPPRLAGAEALLRWRHPLRGVLAPDAFIGLAERSGLIVAIGDWVLDRACAQLRLWHDAGHGDDSGLLGEEGCDGADHGVRFGPSATPLERGMHSWSDRTRTIRNGPQGRRRANGRWAG